MTQTAETTKTDNAEGKAPAESKAPAQGSATPADKPKPAPATQKLPDALANLVFRALPQKSDDVRSAQKRLTQLADEDRDRLFAEIGRTVMAFVNEGVDDLIVLGNEVISFRNWAALTIPQHAEVIDGLASRLEYIEDVVFGGTSQLTSEDAALFMQVADAAEQFARASLEHTPPEGKAKLEQILAIVSTAQERIGEIEIDFDDGEDDDGDGD